MMLAPKDRDKYIKMICVESIEFVDKVWGDCSLIKGNTYEVLIDAKQNHVDGWYLVKFGTGLCPHRSDERLDNLLK